MGEAHYLGVVYYEVGVGFRFSAADGSLCGPYTTVAELGATIATVMAVRVAAHTHATQVASAAKDPATLAPQPKGLRQASYKLLADGQWGLSGSGPVPAPGDFVNVVMKNKTTRMERCGDIVAVHSWGWIANKFDAKAAASAPTTAVKPPLLSKPEPAFAPTPVQKMPAAPTLPSAPTFPIPVSVKRMIDMDLEDLPGLELVEAETDGEY